jgi:hypothetical protein
MRQKLLCDGVGVAPLIRRVHRHSGLRWGQGNDEESDTVSPQPTLSACNSASYFSPLGMVQTVCKFLAAGTLLQSWSDRRVAKSMYLISQILLMLLAVMLCTQAVATEGVRAAS